MSIIYEALKKLETKPPLEGKIFFSEPKQRKSKFFLKWMLSAYIIILCLGTFYLVMQLRSARKQPHKTREANLPAKTPTYSSSSFKTDVYSPSFSSASLQLPKEKELSPLILNGILFMDGEYLALLNNQIVKKGDSLDGVYILDIQPHQVELLFKGERLKLRVPK